MKYKLLCFCDASACAYAAAIFLHQRKSDCHSKVDLFFSKTRLAPVKGLTIPRLELMAVLIGVRCVTFVKDQLRLPLEQIHLWTDSQCVLKRISSDKDLTVFVRNRVREIKSHSEIQFHYINTKENPADIATGESTMHKFRDNELW